MHFGDPFSPVLAVERGLPLLLPFVFDIFLLPSSSSSPPLSRLCEHKLELRLMIVIQGQRYSLPSDRHNTYHAGS